MNFIAIIITIKVTMIIVIAAAFSIPELMRPRPHAAGHFFHSHGRGGKREGESDRGVCLFGVLIVAGQFHPKGCILNTATPRLDLHLPR